MSKWYLTGLFNWVDSDLEELNYQAATFHAGYILRRNLRIVCRIYPAIFRDLIWKGKCRVCCCFLIGKKDL